MSVDGGRDRGPRDADAADPAERELLDRLAALSAGPANLGGSADGDPEGPLAPGSDLTGAALLTTLDAMLTSRQLDHAARWLRARGTGFYTIGSAGHESNALVAAALRPTDPALLHYRSGAFYIRRTMQVDGHDGAADVVRGLVASVDEPIAGGRHKVFGHPDLAVIPQTSTIASHLPRALGVAFAIDRAGRIGVETRWPADAIVVCSFGDASLNHSTAQGALNAAAYTTFSGMGLPLLFVCEDNGWGISVPTPAGWVEASLSGRAGLRYERAAGTDPVGVFDVAEDLVDWVRSRRRPAVLHLRTVRYGGHAGTDVESSYRSTASLRADAELDPIVATARVAVGARLVSAADVCTRYAQVGGRVRRLAESCSREQRLASAPDVMAPIAPHHPDAVARVARTGATGDRRDRWFTTLPEHEGALTLAESINRTLADLLAADPGVVVFGEDVGRKGGVYGVTRGLQRLAGRARVFDTLVDEQSILGLALGLGVSGLLPIAEIQYLAYLHNAEDQLRGEASSLAFFSQGSYTNPMVVRIAGYGYQKGFGGHFHNDNSVAVLRDIPGLVIASPSQPGDAAGMLRTCAAAARTDGTVCAFLEPIALYHTRDLHQPGDGGWLDPYVEPAAWGDHHVALGEPALARPGRDVMIVTWGNGAYMSLRVAERLAAAGIDVGVVDLRWLAPLPTGTAARMAAECGRVVVVDETRRSGGVGEAIVAGLVDAGFDGPIVRVAAHDSFVPLGEAAELVLVSEADIERGVRQVFGGT